MTGTNNGGGARWNMMTRAVCPLCGLNKPVGVYQGERNGNRCNNQSKCRERAARKKKKEATP